MKSSLPAMLAGLVLLAGPAWAECPAPSSDELDIPDGGSATREQMLAAVQRVKAYQAQMEGFRQCLSAELDAMPQPAPPEAVQFHDLRHNASITSEEAVAERLNAEIRAFKAANTP